MEEWRHEFSYWASEMYPGRYIGFGVNGNEIAINTDNHCILRIYLLSDEIIRFRYIVNKYNNGYFSYAIDPDFQKQECEFRVIEESDCIIVTTKKMKCIISKLHLHVSIYNSKGDLLSADEKGFHYEPNDLFGGEIVKMSKYAMREEAFFGLGDKTADQNIRGRYFQNWSTDEFGYRVDSDPLYKNINFFYGLNHGLCYGLFFDNSYKVHYDIAASQHKVVSFWAEGGEMDYYFIYGENLLEVASNYTLLTGRPEMPAMWSLGYQQSKWSYYPESQVREIASRLRAEKIPCDAIYLDIDYMDGFRCFTWDQERFPNPKMMVRDLLNDGFKTVAIIDPGIKIDDTYDIFIQGLDQDLYCKRMDGEYVSGKVWPGMCYFPDFTNPKAREWWAGLFKELIADIGLAGIWNDMNEPAIFDVPAKTFPLDVRHDYDGHPCSHRKAHNVYGMQMTRASAEGVKRFSGNKRPLLITRSGYAGMQRYTSTWTGDNIASWEHLYLAHMQTMRLSISGISFCGSDIGGFIDQPDGELFVRWIQLGIFHPFFRNHSSGDHGDQEPWAFGAEILALTRKFIEIRYRLLPYMYTTFYQYHQFGIPVLRPLVFAEKETNPRTLKTHIECFLGDHMLFSPVLQHGIREHKIFLPKGRWYHYENNKTFKGNKGYIIPAKLSDLPAFVREGGIVPHFPLMQYVGEKEVQEVTLKVYVGRYRTESYFYHDDMDGHQYKAGDYRYTKFIFSRKGNEIFIHQEYEGQHIPTFSLYNFEIIGLKSNAINMKSDGVSITAYNWTASKTLNFKISREFTEIKITINKDYQQ